MVKAPNPYAPQNLLYRCARSPRASQTRSPSSGRTFARAAGEREASRRRRRPDERRPLPPRDPPRAAVTRRGRVPTRKPTVDDCGVTTWPVRARSARPSFSSFVLLLPPTPDAAPPHTRQSVTSEASRTRHRRVTRPAPDARHKVTKSHAHARTHSRASSPLSPASRRRPLQPSSRRTARRSRRAAPRRRASQR